MISVRRSVCSGAITPIFPPSSLAECLVVRGGYPLGMQTISFARGVPAPECLPVEELADCARAALARDGRTILSYGPSPGYGPLREWIAERHGADPARVLLSNGSLQG